MNDPSPREAPAEVAAPPRGAAHAATADTGSGWRWAVVVVLSLHFLTTQGTWIVSDHGEMIFTARRLLTAGSFDFGGPDERIKGLLWLRNEPGQPSRPRLFPGTPIALLPLVALDHALGLDRTYDYGFFVHFAGHLFVGAALVLVGLTLRREGASDRAAAAAILIAGTAWPIWQISRRGGTEPILALLVAAYLLAASAGRFRPRAAIAVLLPWFHPTGSLLAPILAFSEAPRAEFWRPDAAGRRPLLRQALVLLGCALGGTLSVMSIWNWLYHGNFFGGGYALYGARGAVLLVEPSYVFTYYVRYSLLLIPVLVLLAVAGALQAGWQGLRVLALPLVVLAAFLVLFSLYTHPTAVEPPRRLSIPWLLFALSLGRTFDGLRLSRAAASGLVLLSMLIGYYWYRLIESDYYPWYDDSWEPLGLWITLGAQGKPLWWSAVPVALLAALGAFAAFRAARAFRSQP